jgi:hypothetical protein
MHKSATKCNETLGKWFKNKHGASKIIDTFETYRTFSWGSQLVGHLHHQYRTINKFSGTVAGEREDFCKGSLARTIFYFVYCFALLYFWLHLFIKNTQKLASFIVAFIYLLLFLLEWVLLKTPSCVTLLAPKTMILSALLLHHLLLTQIFMRSNLL